MVAKHSDGKHHGSDDKLTKQPRSTNDMRRLEQCHEQSRQRLVRAVRVLDAMRKASR